MSYWFFSVSASLIILQRLKQLINFGGWKMKRSSVNRKCENRLSCNIPCFGEGCRDFLAGGSVSSTHATLVKLLAGPNNSVTTSLDALTLDADRGGVGATWSTISNLYWGNKKQLIRSNHYITGKHTITILVKYELSVVLKPWNRSLSLKLSLWKEVETFWSIVHQLPNLE